jgi:hypothetical protein
MLDTWKAAIVFGLLLTVFLTPQARGQSPEMPPQIAKTVSAFSGHWVFEGTNLDPGAVSDDPLLSQYFDGPLPVLRRGPKVVRAVRHVVEGNPDQKHISTSLVGRQTLTMRMGMRRFTRLPLRVLMLGA